MVGGNHKLHTRQPGTGQKLPDSVNYKGKLQRDHRGKQGGRWREAAAQAREQVPGPRFSMMGRKKWCPTGGKGEPALHSEYGLEEPPAKSGWADSSCRLGDGYGAGTRLAYTIWAFSS